MSFPRYTDLITIDDLKDMSLLSLPEDLREALTTSTPTSDQTTLIDGVRRIISFWSGRIENALGRKLIVRPYENFSFTPESWKQRPEFSIPGTTNVIATRVPEFPVLQFEALNNDMTLASELSIYGRNSEFIGFDTSVRTDCPTFVSFYWGFRRCDQSPPSSSSSGSGAGSGAGSGDAAVTDWDTALGTGDNSLAGLSTSVFVPILPDEIALACQRLVVAEVRAQSRGVIGMRESTYRADRLQSRTSRVEKNFIEEELEPLYTYKVGL